MAERVDRTGAEQIYRDATLIEGAGKCLQNVCKKATVCNILRSCLLSLYLIHNYSWRMRQQGITGGYGGWSLILPSLACFGSKKFQLLILSLKETEAVNTETDRLRPWICVHTDVCTNTGTSNHTGANHRSLKHIISCFSALFHSGLLPLACVLHKQMMNAC